MRHKIRGKIWEVVYKRKLPADARGMCDSPTLKGKKITIKQNLRGLAKLDTLLHEGIHAGLWDLDEEAVAELAGDLARMVWKELELDKRGKLKTKGLNDE